MKYFFDNNLSPRYAAMLRALGVDAVALRDELPENASDVELFEVLSGRNVVFVTADRKIKTRQVEFRALRAARVTSLFIAPFWNKLDLWQQAAWLVKTWPRIEGFVDGAAKGTCAEVRQSGKSVVMPV